MSFLDDVISTGKNVVSAAGKKTDEAVRFSKLKIKESQLNGDIKNKFEKLGALIYQMAKADEKDNVQFDALIAEIDVCYDELSEIEKQFDELRNEVTCPACGEKSKIDNNFCPKCGAKLPERPVKADASDETAVSEDEENKIDENKDGE